MNNQVLLSGVAPSGNFHIGNYLGAIKRWVELQKEYRVFAMIADLHAITIPQDPEKLHAKTLEIAKLLVSCGIDPKKSVIFLQSQVPAHAELGWILNTLTPLGELERMTQFKEKQEKAGVLAGLLNYPTLMAADILLYNADAVPVGEDQLQHLELTRTLARKFNSRFGQTFNEPEAIVNNDTKRLMGLADPTQKMSKSAENHNNYIALLDSPDEIRRKIKIAVTDSDTGIGLNSSRGPAIENLLNIYAAFFNNKTSKIISKYSGKGYAEFKKDLAELIVEKLSPIQKKYSALSDKKIKNILGAGAKKASTLANQTLKDVKTKIGLLI